MFADKFLAMPFSDLRRRLDQSAAYDWVMRFPIIVYYLVLLFRDINGFRHEVLQDPTAFLDWDSSMVMAMLARISMWMFIVLLSIQPLFRLRAIRKSDEILPRLAALAGITIPLMFVLLERAPANAAFNLVSLAIVLVANVMCVVTVSFLGRSLSIMPEARRLVSDGPYGIVRHPLYICELLAMVGVALQYRSLAAAGLVVLAIIAQVARAYWEEGILARAFPDFAAYRARTSFLFPRDPVHFLAAFFVEPRVRLRSVLTMASMVAVMAALAVTLPRLMA
jgi:protein-S-isoprenylcysteine O-methyltransferase Ste14